jgi:hypothetical protein
VKSSLSNFAARLRQLIESAPDVFADEKRFDSLAQELFALQLEANPVYRRYCEFRGATPETVKAWVGIPAMPTAAFKEYDVTSLPEAERQFVFQSSGTTIGDRGRHYHSRESLGLYEASLLAWFETRVLAKRRQSYRVLSLTPSLQLAPNSSLVHMFDTIRREHGSAETLFAGVVGADGSWQLDHERAIEFVDNCASGDPVLVLGTAFSYVHLTDHLVDHKLSLKLPGGSMVLESGGYKGRSRFVPRTELHSELSRLLGLKLADIRTEYGMSELSSQAYDFSHSGQEATALFAFPPWARVQVISSETGERAGEGGSGLIRVFDLANVWSVMAIQTEDLGIDRGSRFELLGRAPAAEPRGCSLMPS